MVPLAALWLPILLSAVAIFLVSSVIHMALPWHRSDYARVPDEPALRAALRPLALPPGDYMVPKPSGPQDLNSPEFLTRVNEGPNLVVTVLPSGPWTMGRNLGLWFLYLLVIALFSAYVAGRALTRQTEYAEVFRFVGTAAFLGFAPALWQMSIWYRRSWLTSFKSTVDGLIYALVVAAIFGWLWPR